MYKRPKILWKESGRNFRLSEWDDFFNKVDGVANKLLETQSSSLESVIDVLPHAPNIIQWVTGSEYLNIQSVIDEHVRQYQILRDFFQLRCPICNSMRPESIDCWGKSRMELESELLLEWNVSLQDEVCPKCRNTKQEFLVDGMLKPYDSMTGCSGMRSGKSVLAGMIGTYVEHEIAIVGDMQKYFETMAKDPFEVSFVATTAAQAEETIYAKYRAIRGNSPWMKKYIAWVKEQEKLQITPIGMQKWEYKETDSVVSNGLLKVDFNSLNSNSAGLAGRTRVASFIDELSRFDTTDSKRSADEVVRVLNQGLKTVRGVRDKRHLRPWWGLLCAISSPIHEYDKTMTMIKETQDGKTSRRYVFHYATWEFNPKQPRETFDEEFAIDPVGAQRDYGAKPQGAETPFIDDMERFKLAIDRDLKPNVLFTDINLEDPTGRKYVAKEVAHTQLETEHLHFICFDAGASFDTFAGASAHGEWRKMVDPETGKATNTWVTVFDWVMGIKPVTSKESDNRRTVYFDCIVKIIEHLRRFTRISQVCFDRWNSEKLIQDIRQHGVPTENYSIKTEDFMSFLRCCYEGKVHLLPPRPDEPYDVKLKNDEEKAIYELRRLERSPDLRRIYNPKKGKVHGLDSDDLAQVVVGVHRMVQSSMVHVTDSTSHKEVLKREQVEGNRYYAPHLGGMGGGRIAKGRRW